MLIGKIWLVYLDDVVFFGSIVNELLQHFHMVFEKLGSVILKLSSKKRQLFQKEVGYLVSLILEKFLPADLQKTNVIATWPVPKNTHAVRSFNPITFDLRKVNQIVESQITLHWTNECQPAFEDLKKKLCSPLILTSPDPKKQFILDTDASLKTTV